MNARPTAAIPAVLAAARRQNIAAASIDLGPEEIKAITSATRGRSSPR